MKEHFFFLKQQNNLLRIDLTDTSNMDEWKYLVFYFTKVINNKTTTAFEFVIHSSFPDLDSYTGFMAFKTTETTNQLSSITLLDSVPEGDTSLIQMTEVKVWKKKVNLFEDVIKNNFRL